MLFNSHSFIFGFLPITIILFLILRNLDWNKTSIAWLALASLFFYGFWDKYYIFLLILSIATNYFVGKAINNLQTSKIFWLIFGLTFNLAILAYYKYTSFFSSLFLDDSTRNYFDLDNIALPLAISFFTFQQIAYLVDIYRGETTLHRWYEYITFVSFFPQLIAGPIVRKQELLPQIEKLARKGKKRFSGWIAAGFTVFTIGLFKKTVLADHFALYANPIFDAASRGEIIGFVDGWGGAVAYSFQLYFDFSGYSDMAIGLALMFGIRLPMNFNSPYKSTSLIEFWRRWHITLSQFFLNYVYIPLGGNRVSKNRQVVNLVLVMLLVGLWHGAGWTFIAWGLYHGFLLAFVHVFGGVIKMKILNIGIFNVLVINFFLWALTFFVVVCGWVLFRAESFYTVQQIYLGMFFTNGFVNGHANYEFLDAITNYFLIAVAFVITLALPNSHQIMQNSYNVYNPEALKSLDGIRQKFIWKLNKKWMLIVACFLYMSISAMQSVTSEFLYFNF